jgi:hypothetical protein
VDDYFSRVWNDLIGRISGPLSLRLLLQPTMATIFAIRDGLKDARTGQPPYFYSLFTDPDQRRSMLREGWHAVAKIFILAVILDLVYQLIVFRWIYPLESLMVAAILALLPYLLLRGPVKRMARKFGGAEIKQSQGNRTGAQSMIRGQFKVRGMKA